MKWRLNIGIALLHEPSLLILDEPTVGVDPQSRDAIVASVDQLGASGIAVLYTTYYMEAAERLCDRVGIVDHGRLVAEGTRRELVALVGEHDQVRPSLENGEKAAAARLHAKPEVVKLLSSDYTLDLSLSEAHRRLPSILSAVNDVGARVLSVGVVEPDLEAIFMHLTGRALRN